MKTIFRKQFFMLLFMIFFISFLSFSSYGQCVSHTTNTNSTITRSDFAQSFTTPASGCNNYFSKITISGSTASGSDETVYIEIFEGKTINNWAKRRYVKSGFYATGTSGEQIFTLTGVPANGILNFSPNTEYTFHIIAGGNINLDASTTSDYAGGQAHAGSFSATNDFYFKVHTSVTDPYLPVELMSFEGEKENTSVALTWETASEKNNEGFEVQRSMDGEEWTAIDFVKGNGTTTTTSSYHFVDDAPFFGNNYYRLKQIDFDGKFEYTHVVSVVSETLSETIQLFPNPVTDELNITDGEGEAIIYNLLGQPIRSFSIPNSTFSINTSDLAKGQYILSIQQENGTIATKRFVK